MSDQSDHPKTARYRARIFADRALASLDNIEFADAFYQATDSGDATSAEDAERISEHTKPILARIIEQLKDARAIETAFLAATSPELAPELYAGARACAGRMLDDLEHLDGTLFENLTSVYRPDLCLGKGEAEDDNPNLGDRLNAQVVEDRKFIGAIREQFTAVVTALLLDGVRQRIEAAPQVARSTTMAQGDIDAIRTFFLQPKRTYTIAELEALFSTTAEALHEYGVGDDKPAVTWEDAGVYVCGVFAAAELEDALGPDASECLPKAYRTRTVVLRLADHALRELEARAAEVGRHGRTAITATDIAGVIERGSDDDTPNLLFPASR